MFFNKSSLQTTQLIAIIQTINIFQFSSKELFGETQNIIVQYDNNHYGCNAGGNYYCRGTANKWIFNFSLTNYLVEQELIAGEMKTLISTTPLKTVAKSHPPSFFWLNRYTNLSPLSTSFVLIIIQISSELFSSNSCYDNRKIYKSVDFSVNCSLPSRILVQYSFKVTL